MAFIRNAVESLAPFGMGMDEDKLITFTYNLRVEARDCWSVDDDSVRRIAPDINDRLIQRINVLLMMGICADFERCHTRRHAHSSRVAALTEKRSSLRARFGILLSSHCGDI